MLAKCMVAFKALRKERESRLAIEKEHQQRKRMLLQFVEKLKETQTTEIQCQNDSINMRSDNDHDIVLNKSTEEEPTPINTVPTAMQQSKLVPTQIWQSHQTMQCSETSENIPREVEYLLPIEEVKESPQTESTSVMKLTESVEARPHTEEKSQKVEEYKPLVAIPAKPKVVTQMEQRAKERKDKRSALNQLYEEKRKAKELEKQMEMRKKMEEERLQKIKIREEKLSKQKLQKQKEEKLRAEKLREEELMCKATIADNSRLKKKLFIALKKISRYYYSVTQKIQNIQLMHNSKDILQEWHALYIEASVASDENYKFAAKHYKCNTLQRCLKILKENKAGTCEKQEKRRTLSFKTKTRLFKQWRALVPMLRQGTIEMEGKQKEILSKCYIRMCQEKLYSVWKVYSQKLKEEKEAEATRKSLLSKVSQWLKEIDSAKDPIDDDIVL